MQSRTCILSAFTLSTGMAFSAAVMAANIANEGTFSGALPATGTYKLYPMGKDRAVFDFESNGLTVGTGFLDHMTLHCYGDGNIAGALEWYHSTCIMTDTAGDPIVSVWNSDKHEHDKAYNYTGTFTAGTGKYAGITGDLTAASESPVAFRTADPAANFGYYATIKANYKLP